MRFLVSGSLERNLGSYDDRNRNQVFLLRNDFNVTPAFGVCTFSEYFYEQYMSLFVILCIDQSARFASCFQLNDTNERPECRFSRSCTVPNGGFLEFRLAPIFDQDSTR